MKVKQENILKFFWVTSALAISICATAAPVVYTLRTVSDGKIGNHAFAEALVTIQMTADTSTVAKAPSLVNSAAFVYTNRVGKATVRIDDAGTVIFANFAPGEIYVRYDTGAGTAGFGSAISPTYPVFLDCSNFAYPSDSTYTKDCLQGDSWGNPNYYNGTLAGMATGQTGDYPGYTPSPQILALPQLLSRSTLLTGRAHACAGLYEIGTNINDGDLMVCGQAAPKGLRTDKGGLYLQDMVGGSTYTDLFDGWSESNSGSLHVEVMTND